jgi:hypothetical protein
MPDHSPFTPHPALQLGSDEATTTTTAETISNRRNAPKSSPLVMPHYKETSSFPTPTRTMTHNPARGQTRPPTKHYFTSTEEKEEALLLEYYWSHYWHRSLS